MHGLKRAVGRRPSELPARHRSKLKTNVRRGEYPRRRQSGLESRLHNLRVVRCFEIAFVVRGEWFGHGRSVVQSVFRLPLRPPPQIGVDPLNSQIKSMIRIITTIRSTTNARLWANSSTSKLYSP